MSPDFLDRYARGDTICHRAPAAVKLVATLAVILAAVLVPLSQWPWLGCLACVTFAALSIARIPMKYLVRRILLLVPALAGLAGSVILARGVAAGGEMALEIAARAGVSFLAGLWLVNVTPFEKLLVAAQRLGLPPLFASLLAMMYRYLFVVFGEFARMQTARRARAFGRRSVWLQWRDSASLLGRLLIRSVDRAERIHGAMCARGWQGRVRSLEI